VILEPLCLQKHTHFTVTSNKPRLSTKRQGVQKCIQYWFRSAGFGHFRIFYCKL